MSLASGGVKGQMFLFCTHQYHRGGSQNITDLKYVSELNIVCSAHPSYALSFMFTHWIFPSSLIAWTLGEECPRTSRDPKMRPNTRKWELVSKEERHLRETFIIQGNCSPSWLLIRAAPSPRLCQGNVQEGTSIFFSGPALGATVTGLSGKCSNMGQSSSSLRTSEIRRK